jgi:hypothetical protein
MIELVVVGGKTTKISLILYSLHFSVDGRRIEFFRELITGGWVKKRRSARNFSLGAGLILKLRESCEARQRFNIIWRSSVCGPKLTLTFNHQRIIQNMC